MKVAIDLGAIRIYRDREKSDIIYIESSKVNPRMLKEILRYIGFKSSQIYPWTKNGVTIIGTTIEEVRRRLKSIEI